jgi:hypothetical protein
MGENPNNKIDWFVPSTPAEGPAARPPTTAEIAARERARQKQVADALLGKAAGLTLDEGGRDPYNSVGRRPR